MGRLLNEQVEFKNLTDVIVYKYWLRELGQTNKSRLYRPFSHYGDLAG